LNFLDDMLSSEHAYLKNVNIFLDVYIKPLQNIAEKPKEAKEFLTMKELEALFPDTSSLVVVSTQLMQALEGSLAPDPNLENIIENRIFDIFSYHLKFFTTARFDPRCQGSTFLDYLLIPVKRVKNYVTIFSDLVKKSKPDFQEMLDYLTLLSDNVQNGIVTCFQTLALQMEIKDNSFQAFPGRRFIQSDPINKLTIDKKGKIKIRKTLVFHLFSDTLLITKPLKEKPADVIINEETDIILLSSKTYKAKGIYELKDTVKRTQIMSVSGVNLNGLTNTFQMVLSSAPLDILYYEALSEQSMKEWISLLSLKKSESFPVFSPKNEK